MTISLFLFIVALIVAVLYVALALPPGRREAARELMKVSFIALAIAWCLLIAFRGRPFISN